MKFARWGTRLVAALAITLMGSVGCAGIAAGATPVPYTDPSVVGSIGLCNQAGQQITSGSISTTPFAWRAVSTQPAVAPYNNAGRTAILIAYLPLQGLPPGDWSGEQLTSSSRYSNPANPMAAATPADPPLRNFVEDFPPKWDGFIQLRMYLGTADQAAFSLHYPALDVQVTGDTWTAVGGAAVNCNSGTSESIETLLLPKKETGSQSQSKTSATGGTTSAPGTTSSKGSDPGGHTTASGGSTTTGSGTNKSQALVQPVGSTNHILFIGWITVIVVLVAIMAYLLVRRHRLAPHPHSPKPTKGPSR